MNLNNKVEIIGRLATEPEKKTLDSGTTVVTFNIAVDRDYKDKDGNRPTDFVHCQLFGKRGEAFHTYHEKGSAAHVFGALRVDSWKNEEGQTRSKTFIAVSDFSFLPTSSRSAQKKQAEKAATEAAPF